MTSSTKRGRGGNAGPADADKSPRRVATLYDAVAGRVGYEAFLGEEKASHDRDTKTSSGKAVYPEEVLFRQKGAPQRYEETDAYFAHEKLDPERQRLPDSDLLKTLHYYASNFYSQAVPNAGRWDWRSMDETALLALGILLEEAVASKIGATGDLAFIEGADADEGITGPAVWDGTRYRRSVIARRESVAAPEPARKRRKRASGP